MTRADSIASVLHRPALHRPLLGHELRGRLVQGLGAGSTVAEWTATVPQLAEAIDTALTVHDARAAAAAADPAAAGHALGIQHRGPDMVGVCQCGRVLGRITPGTRLDALAVPWERHTGAALSATA
ncbi:hypothetical protein ACWD11_22640 [Streptomyces sp. NPDC002776]